jgi:hypothetical protein
MLVNEYRLEIQFKKVGRCEIFITFQWSGPDHWNVGLRRTLRRTDFTASLSNEDRGQILGN